VVTASRKLASELGASLHHDGRTGRAAARDLNVQPDLVVGVEIGPGLLAAMSTLTVRIVGVARFSEEK
jgi:hypothetical protein